MHALHSIMFPSTADVAKQAFHNNQPAAQPCSTLTHFTFEWPSLTRTLSQKPLQLVSLYLRAYLLVDEETALENEKIKLTAKVSLYGGPPTDDGGQREITSVEIVQDVTLSRPSDRWIEVDLTEEAQKFWSQVKHSSEVRISLEAGLVDCHKRIRSPAHFFNPAELPPEADGEGALQPLLLVFANDDRLPSPHTKRETGRNKRSADIGCAKHVHMITFSEIGLTNIWIPTSLNIGKCSGSCSESILRAQSSLGTNHARVMSAVKYIQDNAPRQGLEITTNGPANTPCCAPESFSPNTTLVVQDDTATFGIHRDYYKDLVIESCSCQ